MEVKRDLHILFLVTASGSIKDILKHTMTKAGEPGNKASLEHLSDSLVVANH